MPLEKQKGVLTSEQAFKDVDEALGLQSASGQFTAIRNCAAARIRIGGFPSNPILKALTDTLEGDLFLHAFLGREDSDSYSSQMWLYFGNDLSLEAGLFFSKGFRDYLDWTVFKRTKRRLRGVFIANGYENPMRIRTPHL